MEIFVTGTGVVSAIGLNTNENLNGLLAEKTGIRSTNYRGEPSRFLGSVLSSNQELQKELELDFETSRTALLGLKAAKEAWGSTPTDTSLKTGVISGNSVGGMDLTEQIIMSLIAQESTTSLDSLLSHPCGFSSQLIAKELPNVTFCNTISTACSSGANSILQAVQLMKAGKLDRVIAGGTDALSMFTIKGFSSLMIFDAELCKPFDANRSGLNLGEGAGYLLLETAESVNRSGNEILAKVSGCGIANDSYHQTSLSPDGKGAVMSMNAALKDAQLSADDINYVNTHGTSTENNDEVELTALRNVFNDEIPSFASTKSYTGHTLGASGAIEAVYAILAIQNNKAFPSLNIKNHLNESFRALTSSQDHSNSSPIKHVLSNSFGFGGNQTTLIISKA